MATFSTRTKVLIAATAAIAALTLAGCSNSQDNGMSGMPGMSSMTHSPNGDFNNADVMFLQMMYPHHAQAVEMAKLAPGRTQNQQVLDLAARIEKAQSPEMEQMTTMLKSFGMPAPSTQMGHMDNMGGNGMMTQQQMDELSAATGTDFDRKFLTMMIDHHNGAIAQSKTEISTGKNAEVKKLAESIKTAQETEVDEMNKMLAAL